VAAHDSVIEAQRNLEENPESLIIELLHNVAYQGNTLGHSLYAQEKDLPNFTPDVVRAYLKKRCTPEQLIIVGVNTDPEDLCKWTARCFAEGDAAGLGSGRSQTSSSAVPAMYTGGDLRVPQPNPLCHLMFAWEVQGGWSSPELAAITVLQMFLGGGGSFSTGGPGKGMHTRLYTECLNRHHWVESVQASTVMYADSGLFTMYATVVPEHAAEFVQVLHRIFKSLSRVSVEELDRAKNALKSSIHMNLEMRAVMMEDLGRQLVMAGKVGTAHEFGEMVDGVTADDMRMSLRNCLKQNLSVVAYGAIESLPPHEAIKRVLADASVPPERA